ncbi:MAG TPA: phospholipid carrier-dependent glycosyltransferase [Stellaceae bacterium]|nr:phospholipid carrier-dependent glycosyltransferase [Stellaceae bacterium]
MDETRLAGWRPYLLLGLLCLGLYLPGIAAIPVLDRDEARFAQTTRQMLETRDFLDLRFREEARNNKPAGIYWLQAASVAVLSTPHSTAIWPYRVPSLIGASLAVLLSFGLGRRLTGEPRAALLAAVLLASALGTVAEAHIAKTDAALLAAVVAAQGALGIVYVRARAGRHAGPGMAAVFWLAEIAAIYLKGPIGPGLALLTAATLSAADRDLRWLRGLRPLPGIAFAILAVAPWLYAIEHATEGRFLEQSVGHDFLSKVMGGQEMHGAPPLYYLALVWLIFWPGALLLPPALIAGWRRRSEPVFRFLLAWLIPAWLVLELVPTKLPHYALPLFPALALLSACALVDGRHAPRWSRRLGTVLWLLVTLALAAAMIEVPRLFGPGPVTAGIVAAALLVALTIGMLRGRPGPLGRVALLGAMALVFAIPAGVSIMPALSRLWLSRAAATLVAGHKPPAGARLTVIGYNEPSLVFLLDNGFATGMADAPVAAGDEALVSDRQDAAFGRELARRGLAAQTIGAVSGRNYSSGQEMALTLYRIEAK